MVFYNKILRACVLIESVSSEILAELLAQLSTQKVGAAKTEQLKTAAFSSLKALRPFSVDIYRYLIYNKNRPAVYFMKG